MIGSLDNLYNILIEGLSTIPGIQHCGPLPSRRDKVSLPAIFLDMVEFEPSPDPGTGELELVVHWEARVLVSAQQSKLMLWQLVQAVLVWLHHNNFSQFNVGPTKLKQAAPDHFSPEYSGHQVWLVEWSQSLRIGENNWDGKDIIIDTLLVGFPGEPREILEVNKS